MTSEEGTLFDIDRGSLDCLSLMFLFGLRSFRLSGLLFLLTKRKSGRDLRVVWLGCGCCDLPAFPDRFVLVQSEVLPLMLM